MPKEPMWRLVHECAQQLTRDGTVPFTRADLIACVREREPKCNENSVNPMIQGITDNLKGGAPGADGKRLLHSVGRGKFVLARGQSTSRRESLSAEASNEPVQAGEGTKAMDGTLPSTENELRDILVARLRNGLTGGRYTIEAEGKLTYALPSGKRLSHASDILIHDSKTGRRVSVELKYRSAVTDQFKCRAYDAIHMKEQYGESLLTVMLFAKSTAGISIKGAEAICHVFDRFYGVHVQELLAEGGLLALKQDIQRYLN